MIINFVYPNGRMSIDLDQFFPTTQRRAKKKFQLMVPNLDQKKVRELKEYLKNHEKYLRILEAVQR